MPKVKQFYGSRPDQFKWVDKKEEPVVEEKKSKPTPKTKTTIWPKKKSK